MATPKQERFCKEYLLDCNAAQAAMRAGFSPNSAPRLMKNPQVVQRISQLMNQKDAALIAQADEVLQTLTRVLRREETDEMVVTTKEKTPHACEDGSIRMAERESTQVVELRPKISDVNRAAELLGKRYGLYRDVVDMEGGLPVIVDNVPLQNKQQGKMNAEAREAQGEADGS